MTRVEEINCLADLIPYRLRWRRLWGETRGASFITSFDWLEARCRRLERDRRLRVLIIAHGREPLGILPLEMKDRYCAWGTVRVLSYPLDAGLSGYGPIGPNPTATLLAGLRHIQYSPHDWDVLELHGVQAATDRGRTEHALRQTGFRPMRSVDATAASIELRAHVSASGIDGAIRSASSTATVQMDGGALGSVQYLRYRPRGLAFDDADPRWDLLAACEEVDRKLQALPVTVGRPPEALASPNTYRRDLHELAVTAGAADMHLLFSAGRPIAYVYGYFGQGWTAVAATGVAADAAPLGAGQVLVAKMCESCCRAGDQGYHLGVAGGLVPRNGTTRIHPIENYTHFAGGTRTQLLRLQGWLQHWRRRGAPKVGWK